MTERTTFAWTFPPPSETQREAMQSVIADTCDEDIDSLVNALEIIGKITVSFSGPDRIATLQACLTDVQCQQIDDYTTRLWRAYNALTSPAPAGVQ